MQLASLELEPIRIPFRHAFKHAAATRAMTESVRVVASDASGLRGYGEGCPRAYVTGESLASARALLEAQCSALLAAVDSVATLTAWVQSHGDVIDANPAAWCAIELALLDLLGKAQGCSIEQLLGLPPLGDTFRYSAVLGDADIAGFRTQLAAYRARGFVDFKIKLSGDLAHDRAKLACFDERSSTMTVRADANNLWHSCAEAEAYLRALDYPLTAIEEPLAVGRLDELHRLGETTGIAQILDESLLRVEQLASLDHVATQWIANVRVSKLGGILRSLALVDRARACGLAIIVGAHVGETSLLTRAALPVAQRAGAALLAQEGAFGTHLLACDPCVPVLEFGDGGVLDISTTGLRRGCGLGFSQPR